MTTPAGSADDQPRKRLPEEPDNVISGEYAVRDDHGGPSGAGDSGPRYLKAEPIQPGPFGGMSGFGAPAGTPAGPGYTVYQPGAGPLPDPASLKLKNPFLAGVLGIAFGPIGLAYVTLAGALVALLVAAGLLAAGLWVLLPLLWVACATTGFASALRHNARVMLAAVAEAGGTRYPPQR